MSCHLNNIFLYCCPLVKINTNYTCIQLSYNGFTVNPSFIDGFRVTYDTLNMILHHIYSYSNRDPTNYVGTDCNDKNGESIKHEIPSGSLLCYNISYSCIFHTYI